MTNDFEPIDYATLMQTNIELEAALAKKSRTVLSVVAENAGLLLAVDDSITMLITYLAERGVSADQAEALPFVKALRQAIAIPSTADAIQTLVQAGTYKDEKSLKARISASIIEHCGSLPNCDEDIHQSDRYLIGSSSVLLDVCTELDLYQREVEEGQAA